jgi:hypothetical protein
MLDLIKSEQSWQTLSQEFQPKAKLGKPSIGSAIMIHDLFCPQVSVSSFGLLRLLSRSLLRNKFDAKSRN